MDATHPPQVALDPQTLEALSIQLVATLKEVCGKDANCMEALKDMPSAWVKQKASQVRELGEANAPWICYWIDPNRRERSRTCGPGKEGKRLANRFKKQVEAELLLGSYGTNSNKVWAEFRREYEDKVLSGLAESTRVNARYALDHFERIVKPGKVSRLTTAMIDQYRAARRKEPSRKTKGPVAASTINHEIVCLQTAVRKAQKWGYLKELPDFGKERTVRHIKEHMPPEHFAAVYAVCDRATLPGGQAYPPGDWWRGLLATIYLTGWRRGAVLKLARADVDLERGSVLVRGETTKGRRDQRVPLHPVVVEHLKRLPGFSAEMFPCSCSVRNLDHILHRLCRLAGVPRYGFHSLKRAFCTLNASRIVPSALGFLAQHQHYSTTVEHYINPAAAIGEAVANLFVPEVLRTGTGG